MDREHTTESRQLLSSFVNSTYFDVVAAPSSMAEVERLMDRGQARAALVIPEGHDPRPARGAPGERAGPRQRRQREHGVGRLRLCAGHRPGRLGRAAARARRRRPGLAAPISVEPRIWYNPELKSTLFLVPGLIAFIVMISCVVSTALSVVREKERGTWEQVRMAPISTPSYIVGKTIPYFFISLGAAFLIIAAAMLLFGLPQRGSWVLLFCAVAAVRVRRPGDRAARVHARREPGDGVPGRAS